MPFLDAASPTMDLWSKGCLDCRHLRLAKAMFRPLIGAIVIVSLETGVKGSSILVRYYSCLYIQDSMGPGLADAA